MDFNERIERLAELEAKATPGWWLTEKSLCQDLTTPITTTDGTDLLFCRFGLKNADLICALRNEALPLLREMQQALSEARAENERLKALIKLDVLFPDAIEILTADGE